MTYTPCPYCGEDPEITSNHFGHKVIRCPNGHRRSASYAWNQTNKQIIRTFNRVLEHAHFRIGE